MHVAARKIKGNSTKPYTTTLQQAQGQSRTLTLFLIIFARCAKPNVLCVSFRHAAAKLMFAIITVLAFPPNESWSRNVKREFL